MNSCAKVSLHQGLSSSFLNKQALCFVLQVAQGERKS
jgi:hypothetical protein